jgi:UPF0042 nucleotide-binding protein
MGKKPVGDRFLIITGLSGSGKTAASNFLEDFGYYCVDNLPAKLIPSFVDLWKRKEVEIERVALIVDIREAGFLTTFPEILASIRREIEPCVIFLEASDESLIKRFSESRRPHPLKKKKSIRDSVILERERLAEIKSISDEVIDTTEITIVELKKILSRRFCNRSIDTIQVMIVSFGYKYGIPLDSDLVFDTRFLPNPFYVERLRDKTGRNKSVRDYVLESPETKEYMDALFRFLDFLMPKFIAEGKSYLTISVGCTGGKHRSVVLADRLSEHLKSSHYKIKVNHRDIFK